MLWLRVRSACLRTFICRGCDCNLNFAPTPWHRCPCPLCKSGRLTICAISEHSSVHNKTYELQITLHEKQFCVV